MDGNIHNRMVEKCSVAVAVRYVIVKCLCNVAHATCRLGGFAGLLLRLGPHRIDVEQTQVIFLQLEE